MPPDELIRILHASYAAPQEGVTDTELLRRCAVGKDDAAFELLMRRHADMVWRVCRSVVRDFHVAEDAFQATFFVAARNAKAFSGRGTAAGWLYRIARHTALKSRAHRVRSQHSAADLDAVSTDPPDAALAEIAHLLHVELGLLPEKYRAPLVLCYLEGHSHAEAARDLGWPIGTVATRIARGRDRLRDRLTRRGASLSVAGVTAALTAGPVSAAPPTLVTITAGAIAVGSLSPAVHHLARGVQPLMTPSRIAPLVAVRAAHGDAAGAWSEAIGPLQGRLVLVRGRTSNGTPIISSYLDLRNVAGGDNTVEFNLEKATKTWIVTDADGKDLAPTSLAGDWLPTAAQKPILPAGASTRLTLTISGAGIVKDHDGHLELGSEKVWVFPRGKGKTYYLRGKIDLKPTGIRGQWSGTLDLPRVRIPTGRE